MLRPASVTVANSHMHVLVPETLQRCFRIFRQCVDDLNRVNVLHQPSQNRRLITRARPDFQDTIARLRPQLLRHKRYDVRLRNGLAVADLQRPVFITGSARLRGHEFFPGHLRHRG